MKRLFLSLAWLIIVSPLSAQYNWNNLQMSSESEANKFIYKNLQLYVIRAKETFTQAHQNIGKYTILKDAIENKKIIITETSTVDTNRQRQYNPVNNNINQQNNIEQNNLQILNQRLDSFSLGAQVNKLYLENVSGDTIFIMAGEVVKGGQQDRVIAQDMIIPPKSGKIDMTVFCVEHGRWTSNDSSSNSGAPQFNGYFNVSSTTVRKLANVKGDQQEVWNEVENVTSKNKAGSSTGTYTALQQSESFQNDLKEYIAHFTDALKDEKDVIGVVAVTGDRILVCDMFATPELFQKQFPHLLPSYATEAMTNGSEVTLDYRKVQDYLNKILADESQQEKNISGNGSILKDKGFKLHITTY